MGLYKQKNSLFRQNKWSINSRKRKFGIINIHSEKPVEIRFIYDLFKKKLNKKIKFNIINSKKKSYILQSKSAKKYNLIFNSTRSKLEKFISYLN